MKTLKKVMAGALVASMILPMAACKKKKSAKKEVVAESDPYFYAEEVELQVELDPDKELLEKRFDQPIIVGDKIFTFYNIEYKVEQEIKDGISKAEANGDWDTLSELINKEESYHVNKAGIFDLDGKLVSGLEFSENELFLGIASNANGEVLIVTYTMDFNNDSIEYVYNVNKYSSDGANLGKQKLNTTLNIEPSTMEIFPQEDGGLILTDLFGDVFRFDQDGQMTASASVDQLSIVRGGRFFEGSLFHIGNKYYKSVVELSNGRDICLQEIDAKTLAEVGTPIHVTADGIGKVCNANGACYVACANGIQKVDLEKNQTEMFLDWDAVDYDYPNLIGHNFNICSDDEIVCVGQKSVSDSYNYFHDVYTVVRMKRAEKNPHAGKTWIEIGAYGTPDKALMEYVVNYNKQADHKARVRFHDYTADIDVTKQAGFGEADLSDQVYLELQSGTGPDILYNFSKFARFNSEQVLVDLNQFIDGKDGLSRNDYFDNVFRAFETDGKLFQIPATVMLNYSFLGNREYVGQRDGWTYEEFTQVAESLPETVSMQESMEYQDFLECLLYSEMSDLVSFEKKAVYFESDEFKQMLQLVKTYGMPEMNVEDPQAALDWYEKRQQNKSLYQDGKLALTESYLNSVGDYALHSQYDRERAMMIGLPTKTGKGFVADSSTTLAIAAGSNNKEEAWDFIRNIFTEEEQFAYGYQATSVPINRKALDRLNVVVEEGVKKENEEYASMEIYYVDGMIPDLIYIQQSDRDGFVNVIEHIAYHSTMDESILAIIHEESAAYFADQIDLDTVCHRIQDRASKVVQERG